MVNLLLSGEIKIVPIIGRCIYSSKYVVPSSVKYTAVFA